MLETHITPVVCNCDDVSYKAKAQTIDFVTSQFTFELLGLLLYPFFQIYVYYKLFVLLQLVPLKEILLIFQICALTNYNFEAKKKQQHEIQIAKQKLA